ncbi:MAG: hypothetical protein CMJ83_09810 [Planctomycetes bacterium]|nr:hypothetical protein [Planctomycetota bacterium]
MRTRLQDLPGSGGAVEQKRLSEPGAVSEYDSVPLFLVSHLLAGTGSVMDANLAAELEISPGAAIAGRARAGIEGVFSDFPWTITFRDWTGQTYTIGRGEPHWGGGRLDVTFHNADAARSVVRHDVLGLLDAFVRGDIDLDGNLYLITHVKHHGRLRLSWKQALPAMLRYRGFQDRKSASVNVKSHYDIPQEALNIYLDQAYWSYSCGMFEDPDRLDIDELKRVGQGESDDFDSLEKAQWRKFKDAADFIRPKEGETLLDVGCGYGGQLKVALENQPFGKVVGWTHSSNQVREGQQLLADHPGERWELREGDYREDDRVFDHITSTGMISHVGPRGLVPYVRQVRRRIKTGGRYMHHALMRAESEIPHDADVGLVFNKKYVWPGFHWFPVEKHVTAITKNGFQLLGLKNLSAHYAKTTVAWYERMMAREDEMVAYVGQPTFRAWQVFLGGVVQGFLNKTIHVYRIYCEAT